jgi:ubiquinone/menaquinone biosynthesis C-methylase UbiE
MTDLGGIPDGSFDLIYSGQSIEHVTADEADKVLLEARRVLRPGRFDAADTARHWGMFDDIERCYLLAYVCTSA